MQSMCKLLYAVFDLSTLTTRNIENLLKCIFQHSRHETNAIYV